MKNKMIFTALTSILLTLSPIQAQNYNCPLSNYEALQTSQYPEFNAEHWLNQAKEYGKAQNNAQSLNEALYIYSNLIQDNSLDPMIVANAYKGINALIQDHSAEINWQCVLGDIVQTSRGFIFTNDNDEATIKPDVAVIEQINLLKNNIKEFKNFENITPIQLLIIARYSGNPEAKQALQTFVENKEVPYYSLINAITNKTDNINAFVLEYEMPQTLTTDELLETLEWLNIIYTQYYRWTSDKSEEEQLANDRLQEMYYQSIIENIADERFQEILADNVRHYPKGLAELQSVVTTDSSQLSRYSLAQVLYELKEYADSYELLKTLADEGYTPALSMLVLSLSTFYSEVDLSSDEVRSIVNNALVKDKEQHDPLLGKDMYYLFNYSSLLNDILPNVEQNKLKYIERSMLSSFTSDYKQKDYAEAAQVVAAQQELHDLIQANQMKEAYEMWDALRSYKLSEFDRKALQQIADMGSSQAQYRLGLVLEEENNMVEAMCYFAMSGKQGTQAANMAMAYAYASGEGAEQNLDKSVEYFNAIYYEPNDDSGYGDFEKSKSVYNAIYQHMKQKPNEEAIKNLDKNKHWIDHLERDPDAPMFFVLDD